MGLRGFVRWVGSGCEDVLYMLDDARESQDCSIVPKPLGQGSRSAPLEHAHVQQ